MASTQTVYVNGTRMIEHQPFRSNPTGPGDLQMVFDSLSDRDRALVQQAGRQKANSNADSNTDVKDCGANGSSGKPVILATGTKWQLESDFTATGLYAMGLARTYRSVAGVGRLFGSKWFSTLDPMSITIRTGGCYQFEDGCYPRNPAVINPDGTTYEYQLNYVNQTYNSNGSSAQGVLTYQPSPKTWRLYRDKKYYYFNANRMLTSITRPPGSARQSIRPTSKNG